MWELGRGGRGGGEGTKERERGVTVGQKQMQAGYAKRWGRGVV